MISGARSTNDLDRLGESVPAYRPAPDYETAVLSKFQGSNRITQGGRTSGTFVFGLGNFIAYFRLHGQKKVLIAVFLKNYEQFCFLFYWSGLSKGPKFWFFVFKDFFVTAFEFLLNKVAIAELSVARMRCGLLDGAVVFFPSRDTSHHSNTNLYSSPTSCHQGTVHLEKS